MTRAEGISAREVDGVWMSLKIGLLSLCFRSDGGDGSSFLLCDECTGDGLEVVVSWRGAFSSIEEGPWRHAFFSRAPGSVSVKIIPERRQSDSQAWRPI